MATTYGPDGFPLVEPGDRIKDGAAGVENVRIDINKVARKAQDNDTIIRAEAAAATQQVADDLTGFESQTEDNLSTKVETTDPRVPLLGPEERPHAWTDPAGRTALYSDQEGTIHAPLPIVTPGAGIPTSDYLAGTRDPATGKWAEDVLDFDGLTPSVILAAQLLRTPGALIVSEQEPPDPGPGNYIAWLHPTTQVLMIGIGQE